MRRRAFVRKLAFGMMVPSVLHCIATGQPIPFGYWKRLGASLDSEVLDWVSRVNANGGSVSASTTTAHNTWMVGIKADGLRPLIPRKNTYAGTGLNACRTPLIKDIGEAVDVLNNFVAGDYSESTGLTGDGVTKYNDTRTLFQDLYALDTVDHAISFGLYNRSAINTAEHSMGATDGSLYCYLSPSISGTTYFCMTNTGTQVTASESNGTGFYLGVRKNDTDRKIYRNGTQIGSATSSDAGNLAGAAAANIRFIFVHAFANWNFNPAQANAHTSRTFAGYQLSLGFDATQQAALNSRELALQTALNRNV